MISYTRISSNIREREKLKMGCVPSNEMQTIKDHDLTATNNNLIFTIDERLKLKEVWVIVKQNGLKKLGDDIMSR